MFGRRKKEFEYEAYDDVWDDDDFKSGGGVSLPGGFTAVLAIIIAMLVIFALGWGGMQLWRAGTPAYAAEKWFDAMWSMDSETVLDRTCDQEIWVSNALASGASVAGLAEYLDITQIPGLDEFLIPGLDMDSLKDEFEIDRSRIEFAEVSASEETAVVAAKGQIRFRIFKGWYPYRLDETWLMVKEDGRWKWCGRQP